LERKSRFRILIGTSSYHVYFIEIFMSEDQVDLSKLKIRREEPSIAAPPPRKRGGIIMYIGGGIFLALAVFFSIRDMIGSDPIVDVVTVSYISPAQASSLLTSSGYVVAQRKASIASKATGRLVYLGFKEGDKVKEGQIIARIESADMEAALAQAKADLATAKAEQTDVVQRYERARKMFERQLISQAELETAKSQYDRVTATIASRDANVRAAEVQLENTRIRAPFDGTILSKNADIGEVVTPFAAGASSRVAVVTIADMSSLEVEADVSESNIERISIDQPCEISLDAYPDKRYRGVVDKIVPTADRAKATVLTKIRFVEKDSRVLPEMSAKVNFISKKSNDSIDIKPILIVDTSAVTKRNNELTVFVLRDIHVEEMLVTLGRPFGGSVEITSGLSPNDKVVLKPPPSLHSGMAVKLKQ
jgi:HlyD family secretion protein